LSPGTNPQCPFSTRISTRNAGLALDSHGLFAAFPASLKVSPRLGLRSRRGRSGLFRPSSHAPEPADQSSPTVAPGLPIGKRRNRQGRLIRRRALYSPKNGGDLITVGGSGCDSRIHIRCTCDRRRVDLRERSGTTRRAIYVIRERRVSGCRYTRHPCDTCSILRSSRQRAERERQCQEYGYSFHL
jgi:hypothetical protein